MNTKNNQTTTLIFKCANALKLCLCLVVCFSAVCGISSEQSTAKHLVSKKFRPKQIVERLYSNQQEVSKWKRYDKLLIGSGCSVVAGTLCFLLGKKVHEKTDNEVTKVNNITITNKIYIHDKDHIWTQIAEFKPETTDIDIQELKSNEVSENEKGEQEKPENKVFVINNITFTNLKQEESNDDHSDKKNLDNPPNGEKLTTESEKINESINDGESTTSTFNSKPDPPQDDHRGTGRNYRLTTKRIAQNVAQHLADSVGDTFNYIWNLPRELIEMGPKLQEEWRKQGMTQRDAEKMVQGWNRGGTEYPKSSTPSSISSSTSDSKNEDSPPGPGPA